MDLIANVLCSINNGVINKLRFVSCQKSKEVINFLKLLQKEGIISGFLIGKNKIRIYINLKINRIKLLKISKPSNSVYMPINKIRPLNMGSGLSIISTKKGILNDFEARISKNGGELLCQIQ